MRAPAKRRVPHLLAAGGTARSEDGTGGPWSREHKVPPQAPPTRARLLNFLRPFPEVTVKVFRICARSCREVGRCEAGPLCAPAQCVRAGRKWGHPELRTAP